MHVIRTAAALYGFVSFALVALVVVAFGVAWLVQRVRALRCMPRRGLTPLPWVRGADGAPQPLDAGAETDAVPEGFDPRQPHTLFCMACGRGARVPSFATNVGACPDCGGQRYSNRPELPILGEPKERAR